MKQYYTEEEYPFLVNEVMKHIELVKKKDPSAALLDIIYDFAFRNDIEPELVGDAISADVYFKSFIQKDCEMHRILQSDNPTMGEW